MKNISTDQIITGIEQQSRIPYGVSRYYASLAKSQDPWQDPIAAQYVPRKEEMRTLVYESPDPIADGQYSVSDRVIHHYYDRILILVNDRCATYCRHCFRRHFTGSSSGKITEDELQTAVEYLQDTPQIEEVLLSGGDPLMLNDSELEQIILTLRTAVPERSLIFRLASRMPVVLPARITNDLVDMLVEAGKKRLWLVTHANHPLELSSSFEQAAERLIDRGIPILNQAVLLRGVNDSTDVLEKLFRRLIQLRVKPYYLFQGDLAAGTAHFRTSIEEGLDIMDELRDRLSGMAMPVYAVDLPNGGGKIPLTRASIKTIRNGCYILNDRQGREYAYPREK